VPYTQNLLLASLSPGDLALLLPHLKLLHVEQRKVLFEADDEVHTSYFPLTAIISLVLVLQTGDTVESAMVGCDGVVSAALRLTAKSP
jgi:hypothetical protein